MHQKDRICDQVILELRRIIRAIDIHSKDLIQKYGLTSPQLILLKELSKYETMTIGELARNINLSNATVTDILRRLEKRELIKRIKSETDKRRTNIYLTDKCRQMLQNSPPLLQEKFVKNFEKLEEWEQMMLISSLQRIANMMEARDIDASSLLVSGPIIPPIDTKTE